MVDEGAMWSYFSERTPVTYLTLQAINHASAIDKPSVVSREGSWRTRTPFTVNSAYTYAVESMVASECGGSSHKSSLISMIDGYITSLSLR